MMRAMPYRMASNQSVTFADPHLEMGEHTICLGGPVAESWDFLTAFTVVGSVDVDAVELSRSARVPADLVDAVLQVDCPSTGLRRMTKASAQHSAGRTIELRVPIGPDQVAREIEVRYGLVLSTTLPPKPEEVTAYQQWSRLYEGDVFRFKLEGDGSGFPIDAFDFEPAGYPPRAAWWLNFHPESLGNPFLSSVRLYINTAHDQADVLLSGKAGPAQSVLMYGVLEQMLSTVADDWDAAEETTEESGSVGKVLDEMTNLYLGMSLPEAVAALRSNRARVMARLQDSTAFLQGMKP